MPAKSPVTPPPDGDEAPPRTRAARGAETREESDTTTTSAESADNRAADSQNLARAPHTDGDGVEMEPSKRRMPDKIRRYLLRMQGGKFYLPAAYRIVWFRDELGDDWGIRTNLIEGGHEAGFATVHAEVLNPDGRVIASGMKTESKQDFPAGWVEKAESGAVARALALLGFGTQFTPELDDDGYRPADSPQGTASRPAYAQPYAATRTQPEPIREDGPHSAAANGVGRQLPAVSELWEGPGQCPRCHAPEGKRHGKQCLL